MTAQLLTAANSPKVIRLNQTMKSKCLEVNWSAAFNISVGSLQPGDVMKARFAVFLDFAAGFIRRQRNYDCFEPF